MGSEPSPRSIDEIAPGLSTQGFKVLADILSSTSSRLRVRDESGQAILVTVLFLAVVFVAVFLIAVFVLLIFVLILERLESVRDVHTVARDSG